MILVEPKLSRLLSKCKHIVLIVALVLFATPIFSQAQQDDLLLIVESELKREMAEFSKLKQPPYYLAYRVHDTHSAYVSSSFGSLVGSDSDRSRILMTDIKVGDYSFDSSHPISNFEDFDSFDMHRGSAAQLPMDNKPEAIKLLLWQQTQNSYRQALNVYKALKNLPQTENKPISDFSKETAAVYVAPPLPDLKNVFNSEDWKERIKKFSAPFLKHPDIIDAVASLEANTERKYFISSEGARIVQNRTFAYLTIQGSIRAEDGDIIPLHQSYFAIIWE